MSESRLPECADAGRILATRSRILQSIRRFFVDGGFLEVETPARVSTPALELHIDAEPSGNAYLRTSPELHMKRLVASGMERIFQMGPCFRRGERGRLHNPEYTMLEWYRVGADYMDMLAETKALLGRVFQEVLGGATLRYGGDTIALFPVWERLTVREAFLRSAGWDPILDYDADRFDIDLVEKVEPAFPADRPVVLQDYPAQAAALARCKESDPSVAERWELTIGGMELANAFSELTDAAEQRRRFEDCARSRRRMGKEVYACDEAFLSALEKGMPACGGVALGVDRLVMLMTDSRSIEAVRAF